MSYTMQASPTFKAVTAAARTVLLGLRAALGRRRRSEHERLLAGSVDHFDVERRERMRNRWHSVDGSLLGQ